MIAGRLEIEMFSNIARLANDMSEAKKVVGGAMGNIETSIAGAKKALQALGITLSVGYFLSLIKGSIDAMDKLNDLSKSTNIAVEELAGLRIAAKQSGGDLDSIAASINKLSVEMGKTPEKFAALGVSAKDPLKAFQQLSDVFVAIENPQQRAAVAAAALGKAWAGAAPLLAEGGAKIGEMVATGSQMAGVTAEMAQQSDALNDKWVLLTGTGGLLNRTIAPLLPLFNLIAEEMLKTQKSSSVLDNSFTPLKDTIQVLTILGANLAFMFKTMGAEIGGTAAQVAMLATGNLAGVSAIRKAMIEEALKAKADLEEFEKKVMGAQLTGTATPGAKVDPAIASSAAARAKKFLDEGKVKAEEAREQQVRDALHKVREAEDKRELEQIALQNEQRAQQEELRVKIYLDAIDREQEAAIAHGAELMSIDNMVAENKRAAMQNSMQFLGVMAAMMSSKSRQMFEVGKAAAIAETVVQTITAAQGAEASASKIPYVGWILGPIAAAAAIVSGMARVSQIKSTQFGGGGSVSSHGGGGVAVPTFNANPNTGVPTAPLAGTPQSGITLNLTVNGHILDEGQFTDTVLIPALKDAIDNRDVTIIGPNSRQAQDLAPA